jgi:CheY-like chemotaxis protein
MTVRMTSSGVDVLVVDDDRDARELIKRILNDCGATCDGRQRARGLCAVPRGRPTS